MFQNPEIAPADYPGADDLTWEALHPLYSRSIRVLTAIILAVVAMAITALNIVPNIPLLPFLVLYPLLGIAAVISLSWPAFSVPRRGYVLRDRDLLFRKGVIWQSVTAVPFNRIQHVETSSTPLERKFGLATLQLFTAGGSGGDLKINGLGRDVAEQLRAFILDKAGKSIENA